MCYSLSLSLSDSSSDSPPSPAKHPSSKHTHTHTLSPTDFQNKTRLFTNPENPERNHILPFKGCLKFPHRCCCLPFFFLFHVRDFPPCSFPLHLARHSVTLFHSPPDPSISVPMITGRKFLSGREASFWKVVGGDSLSREERKKGIRCWTWTADV